jgi:phage terminase large subunit-like protein
MQILEKKNLTSERSELKLIPGYNPYDTAGDCTYDADAGEEPVRFFSNELQFIEGDKAGLPFKLEDWQECIVRNLFGWKRPDGTRRYRTVFIEVPAKNGKTPLSAGIIDYVAYCEGESGGQIYSAAGEREQAALVFRHASGMIARNPELSKHAKIYRTYRSIEFFDGGVIYKALSAESDTKHGLNAHCIVVDELHVQPNRDLVDTLITRTASRTQPIVIFITTAGYDRNSVCYEIYDYACKVRDGIIDDPYFLPVIYEADSEDDWTSEDVWRKSNPNLGVSVSMDYLTEQCQKAQHLPAYENTFRRLHLNQWTEQDSRWISQAKWNECAVPKIDLTGLDCYAGLDLSSTKDLSAFVMVFPYKGKFYVVPHFFVPMDNAKAREDRDRVPYGQWHKQGFIHCTGGNVVDYDFVRKTINDLADTYHIMSIGIDPWNASHIMTQLMGDGHNVVSFRQGYKSLSAPSKKFEQLILSRELCHFSHPVMDWCVSNVSIEIDAAENIKPSKRKSIERIDGVVGAVMGLGLAITDEIRKDSVYEQRGILTI